MINVNLRPGATRKAQRGIPKLAGLGALSRLKGMPQFDRMTAFIVAGWILGPALIGWMFFSTRNQKAELDRNIEAALADSVKYTQLIQANKTLLARRDTIAMKVNVIQEIDAGRYIWSHIMDELSRALPAYTWLVGMKALPPDSVGALPKFSVSGRAQNNFALTQYLQQLEASPFIRAVKLTSTELIRERDKLVYSFGLEAYYEVPPPDVIETVPLFAREPD